MKNTTMYATIMMSIFGEDGENTTFAELCKKNNMSLGEGYSKLINEWNKYDEVLNGKGNRLMKIPPLEKMKWGWNPSTEMFIDPDGNMYKSVARMCYENEIDNNTARYRLRRGVSFNRAMDAEKMETCNVDPAANVIFGFDEKTGLYTIGDGCYFENIKNLCKHYDMPANYYRLGCEYGFDRKDLAMHHPRFASADHPVIIDGKEYTSMMQISQAYHISTTAIYYQLLFNKRTIKGAINQSKKKTRTKFKEQRFGYSANDKKFYLPGNPEGYKTFSNMCKSHHLSQQTVARRIRRGDSLTDAMAVNI